jgi:hypothetical protein
MNEKTLIVNLFGGPGTGKSSFCAAIFAGLKWKDVNCEMVLEYAKDVVWEESFSKLGNQIYIFGKQIHRIYRLLNKVSVIVTDSPILLSMVYGEKENTVFKDLVLSEFNKQNNMNIFLNRKKKYNPIGRMQSENEAKVLDEQIKKMMVEKNIDFFSIDGFPENVDFIVNKILEKIDGKK